MNYFTPVKGLLHELWASLHENHPGRLAACRSMSDGIRGVVSKKELTALELVNLTQNNLTEQERGFLVRRNTPILKNIHEVRVLVEHDVVDRMARRLALSDSNTYANVTQTNLYDLAMELEPGDGFDDLVMSALPYWVGTTYQFDPIPLLEKAGPLAGAQILAATGSHQLTDEEVWDWITNAPERWAHKDPDRAWHNSYHIRNALEMVFTHRPGLASQAAGYPEMVQYVLRTPHWRSSDAHCIVGIDLDAECITDEATLHTPGTLLSLIWNPKTPVSQVKKIHKIATEAVDTSLYTKEWGITLNAAETRIRVQPQCVDYYETIWGSDMVERLIKRINRGFNQSNDDLSRQLNGEWQGHAMAWPKRFGEYAATLGNNYVEPYIDNDGALDTVVPGTLPENTWTRTQFEKAGKLEPMSPPVKHLEDHPGYGTSEQVEEIRYAAKSFARLSSTEEQQAWDLYMTLAAEAEEPVCQWETSLADTTLAVMG